MKAAFLFVPIFLAAACSKDDGSPDPGGGDFLLEHAFSGGRIK